MTATIDELLATAPIMAIFRNMSPEAAVRLAHHSWDLGIELVEVPIQSADAIPTLKAVLEAGRERGKPVGSGTVTSVEQVALSQSLGVAFTVAPGLDATVLEESTRLSLPHLPGVATATEVQRALALGCTWVKAFPAVALGAMWFTAMRGPFPGVSFVATGGMDSTNAEEFLSAGASTIAVGSALADPEQVDRLIEVIRRS